MGSTLASVLSKLLPTLLQDIPISRVPATLFILWVPSQMTPSLECRVGRLLVEPSDVGLSSHRRYATGVWRAPPEDGLVFTYEHTGIA
jgi:hypothetical protein